MQGLLGGHTGGGLPGVWPRALGTRWLASVESGTLVGCVRVHTRVPSACEPWTWTDTCMPVFVSVATGPGALCRPPLGTAGPASPPTPTPPHRAPAPRAGHPPALRRPASRHGRLAPRPRQVSELPSPRVLRPLLAAGAPTAGQDWRLGGALRVLGQGRELAGSCSACPVAGGRRGGQEPPGALGRAPPLQQHPAPDLWPLPVSSKCQLAGAAPTSPRALLPPEAEPRAGGWGWGPEPPWQPQSSWGEGAGPVQVGVGWFWGVSPGVQ